ALDPTTPRYLRVAGEVATIRDLQAAATAATGQRFRLLRAGGLWVLKLMISLTRRLVPAPKEVFPPWQAAPLLDADVAIPMVVALFFVLLLVAMGIAIAGAFFMLVLLQYLLIAAGTRAGRPAAFGTFRRWLLGYSLVPATLPLLAFGLPTVRDNAG
nr:hypothetical protein [Tanacetum cinerariifolium]